MTLYSKKVHLPVLYQLCRALKAALYHPAASLQQLGVHRVLLIQFSHPQFIMGFELATTNPNLSNMCTKK